MGWSSDCTAVFQSPPATFPARCREYITIALILYGKWELRGTDAVNPISTNLNPVKYIVVHSFIDEVIDFYVFSIHFITFQRKEGQSSEKVCKGCESFESVDFEGSWEGGSAVWIPIV